MLQNGQGGVIIMLQKMHFRGHEYGFASIFMIELDHY